MPTASIRFNRSHQQTLQAERGVVAGIEGGPA
jgi:hypothetical protein